MPHDSLSYKAFLQRLADKPYRYDLFYTLRHVEALNPQQARLGRATLPMHECLRLGQEPSLTFAPTAIAYFHEAAAPARDKLKIYSFGLFGPNGPLPLHLTEYARERIHHEGDVTFSQFADMFHHRLINLFYQAWAMHQPTVSMDRPGDDRISNYLASLINLGQRSLQQRDRIADHAKLYNAAHLVRPTRNPEGLCHALSQYFAAKVSLQEFSGHWLHLSPDQQTVLGKPGSSSQLGIGAIAGKQVWDMQSKFRLCIGPLPLPVYQSFLPGQSNYYALIDWVRNYIGYEFEWDLLLVLRKPEVPQASLGGQGQLGWTTWLGERHTDKDADDLCLNPEKRERRTAALPLQ